MKIKAVDGLAGIFICVLIIAYMVSISSCKPFINALGASSSKQEKIQHYDNSGRYKGYSTIGQDGKIRRYDSSGRYKGYSKDEGGSMKHYDSSGRYDGRTNNYKGYKY